MKYYIYARILGDFLPDTKPITINNCKIEKDLSYTLISFLKEIPQIPVVDPTSVYHVIRQGVDTFIQFSQEPISTRYFESNYFINTYVEEVNPYLALQQAKDKFTKTTAVLSLALKTTMVSVRGRRIRRNGYYDFEIIGIFIKKNKKLIRVKMPEPLISHRNFFPKPFPKKFLSKAKKMVSIRDPVFQKGLEYISRASSMKNSGNYSTLETTLNLIKCIELISTSISIPKIRDAKTGKRKMRKPYMKEYFELAGRKLKVRRKNWKFAIKAWDVRNYSDVAHQSIWDWRAFPLSFESLEESANDYLLKYLKWYQSQI